MAASARRSASITSSTGTRSRCSAKSPGPAAALAAIAYGADGLCLECHVAPSQGIGDDPKQAITPEVLKTLIGKARQLWTLVRS